MQTSSPLATYWQSQSGPNPDLAIFFGQQAWLRDGNVQNKGEDHADENGAENFGASKKQDRRKQER